ncbi:hypothetical protein [Ilyobacter polytropus]|uniref:Lipoprotein n=1 Tax=Ilyobacter polytropus (strain ATCC 51220 / DSM 2926 / LMG 16218 / CuHBu1) TaxID=572544 RepID=E3HDU7_ILYPC|nr:hypothetical protein [Ilyobacter polytropus]ADO84283.1 hypothetical protein Ilyop_2524 [Ilyobacter polytropus DSM 2926]
MKKFMAVFLIIISLSACNNDGSLNSDKKEMSDIQNNSVEAEEIQEENIEFVAEENRSHEVTCYINSAKSMDDPQLEELYGKLLKLQTSADEMSKYPKSSEVLKDITKEIGMIKGLIQYRSLEINTTL